MITNHFDSVDNVIIDFCFLFKHSWRVAAGGLARQCVCARGIGTVVSTRLHFCMQRATDRRSRRPRSMTIIFHHWLAMATTNEKPAVIVLGGKHFAQFLHTQPTWALPSAVKTIIDPRFCFIVIPNIVVFQGHDDCLSIWLNAHNALMNFFASVYCSCLIRHYLALLPLLHTNFHKMTIVVYLILVSYCCS